jgi:hypothetical protein
MPTIKDIKGLALKIAYKRVNNQEEKILGKSYGQGENPRSLVIIFSDNTDLLSLDGVTLPRNSVKDKKQIDQLKSIPKRMVSAKKIMEFRQGVKAGVVKKILKEQDVDLNEDRTAYLFNGVSWVKLDSIADLSKVNGQIYYLSTKQ